MDTGLCSAVRLRPAVRSHGDSSRVVCIILSFCYFKLIRTSLFAKALELSIPPRAGFLATADSRAISLLPSSGCSRHRRLGVWAHCLLDALDADV